MYAELERNTLQANKTPTAMVFTLKCLWLFSFSATCTTPHIPNARMSNEQKSMWQAERKTGKGKFHAEKINLFIKTTAPLKKTQTTIINIFLTRTKERPKADYKMNQL